MSKSYKLVLSVVLVSFVAACAAKDEEITYVDPTPAMSEEPAFTGKYK